MGNNSLAQLFGRSPIQPLQEHMKSVLECVQLLPDFFAATFANDWQQAAIVYNTISSLEKKADAQKKEIRLHMPRSFFMPIPRNDLLMMVTLQDELANTAQDIAGLMLGREMSFPQSMAEKINEYLGGAVNVVTEAKVIIDELDELLETGFSGKEIDLIEKLITRVEDLENDTDDLQIRIRAKLRSLEGELPPVDVMFLYKIIELIGHLADAAKKVGDQIHIIVAR
jgi:uncharacterized protein